MILTILTVLRSRLNMPREKKEILKIKKAPPPAEANDGAVDFRGNHSSLI
tara:strand:- start:2240 stop:2389 length:150 start_codon:yes stop_codon:yes gene_type:complete